MPANSSLCCYNTVQLRIHYFSFNYVAVVCIQLDDKMMKDEIGEACGICGGEKSYVQGCGEETGRKEPTWKTQA